MTPATYKPFTAISDLIITDKQPDGSDTIVSIDDFINYGKEGSDDDTSAERNDFMEGSASMNQDPLTILLHREQQEMADGLRSSPYLPNLIP